MINMTLKCIIKNRKNKYAHKSQRAGNEFVKGYMAGWYWAYRDLEEILEQNKFDLNIAIIKSEKSYNVFQRILLKLFF